MRWVDQVLKHVSKSVLMQESGLSAADIRRAQRGAATPEVNRAIREVQRGGLVQTAKAIDQRITLKQYNYQPPAEKAARAKEPPAPTYDRAKIEKQVSEIKKEYPRLSRESITGLLERDQYTRGKLAVALNDYQAAKRQAEHDYKTRGVKRETLEEYTKRRTAKEYKTLSEAFDQRRKTEKVPQIRKLMTSKYIDLSVERYGRGKGQWHSPNRL